MGNNISFLHNDNAPAHILLVHRDHFAFDFV